MLSRPNTTSLPNKRKSANLDHHTQYSYADHNNSINYVDRKYHHYHQYRYDCCLMHELHLLEFVPNMTPSECYSKWLTE